MPFLFVKKLESVRVFKREKKELHKRGLVFFFVRMEEIEAAAKTNEAISKFLFEISVRKDLENGLLSEADTAPEALRDRYVTVLDSSDVWERLHVQTKNFRPGGDAVKSDAEVVAKILSRHRRIPPVKKIANVLGDEAGESYRMALESLESLVHFQTDSGKVERWKRRSLEIVHSLVVDVVSRHYGKGDLEGAYAEWRRKTYSSRRNDSRMGERKKFWRQTGVWVIGRSDEKKWLAYSRRYGSLEIRKKVRKLVHLCLRLREAVKRNGSRCLRCIPKKRPSYKSISGIDENIEKITAYLSGCCR